MRQADLTRFVIFSFIGLERVWEGMTRKYPLICLVTVKCSLRTSITDINFETFGGVVLDGVTRRVNLPKVFDNIKSCCGE